MPASFLHTENFQSNYYNEMHHIYAQYYTSDLFFPSGKITPLTSPDKKKLNLKWTDKFTNHIKAEEQVTMHY